MKNCSFCKIAHKKEDAAIFWEDKKCIALLDIRPNTPGMALVLTKDHHKSDIFALTNENYINLMVAVKKVIAILKKGLEVKRVAVVVEGLEVNHAHVKLYPLYGLRDSFEKTISDEIVYRPKYRGFISTNFGPEASLSDLKKLAALLKNTK